VLLVQPKPLFRKLDALCVRALSEALALCVARAHPEISVEHFLIKLLAEADGDAPRVLAFFGADPDKLARTLHAALEDIKERTTGRPAFAPMLMELVQDAWMLASVEQDRAQLRSGAILQALCARPLRYLGSEHPELDKVRPEELGGRFAEITAGSSEETAGVAGAGAHDGAASASGPEAVERAGKALARFATNFTALARAGKMDPVLGRDREIRQVVDILARRRKNNPIVVGEAGVGKTAIVEGLALRIAQGDVPDFLRNVDIHGLDVGALSAGAGVKGEFEARLKSVIEEVRAASGRAILFIDEAHTLIGAGGPAGGTDAANLLKPSLARGELRTIAATTWAEYKTYFEEDAALARRFQPVKVDEPSVEDTALMLRGLKDRYEAAHGITVRDDAVDAAAKLAARYITGRLLPDKAVDLLDTATARVRVGQTGRPGLLEDKEREIAALARRRAAVERDRAGGVAVDLGELGRLDGAVARASAERDAIAARWQAQQAAVAKIRELRKAPGDEAARAASEAAMGELRALQGQDALVRVEVDPEVVAQVVSDWTGVPVGRMVRDEARLALELEDRLRERIKGQDHAVATVCRAVREARAGLKDPAKPQVFLLVGPSGVGKTELGLAVADLLFGGERFVVSVNMSEYQDREMGVSGLIGAKPGYVGYGKGGTLTEAVRQRPYAVVLLDEIEKACQEARNLFYQVFDKGNLTDGTGRTIDFKNTLIFMTTNLGADVIEKLCAGGVRPDPAKLTAALRPMLNRALQPAWLARTTVVPFFTLYRGALREIAELKLRRLAARLRESHRTELTVGDAVVARVVERCVDAETGARNIDFVLQDALFPLISTRLLERFAEGASAARVALTLDAAGEFAVQILDGTPPAGDSPPGVSMAKGTAGVDTGSPATPAAAGGEAARPGP
jgi:type VI secretion system protein VasG